MTRRRALHNKVAGARGPGALTVLATEDTLADRPDLGLREVTPATHNSLPSGHTTAVFSVVVAVLVVVPTPPRPQIAITVGAGAVVTALSHHVHWWASGW